MIPVWPGLTSVGSISLQGWVLLAAERGVQRLQVETDSQELVKLWEAVDTQRSSIYPILKEIKDSRAAFFDFSF